MANTLHVHAHCPYCGMAPEYQGLSPISDGQMITCSNCGGQATVLGVETTKVVHVQPTTPVPDYRPPSGEPLRTVENLLGRIDELRAQLQELRGLYRTVVNRGRDLVFDAEVAVASGLTAALRNRLTSECTDVRALAGFTGQTQLAISSTSPLPPAKVGVAYSAVLAGSGGVLPYTWMDLDGLPLGLQLNQSTGEISGVPEETAVGTPTLRFRLVDSSEPVDQRVTRAFSLTISL